MWVLLFWGFARVIWSGTQQARRHAARPPPPRRRRHKHKQHWGRAAANRHPPTAHARGFGFCGRCGWKARALACTRRPTRGSPRGNDPSAGSPTETLLRLHLPLNDKVYLTFHGRAATRTIPATIREVHRTIQSVGATGGVYKGQGRNQCKLMTCAY